MIDGNAVLHMEYSELMREGYKRVLEHFYWLQRLPADDAEVPLDAFRSGARATAPGASSASRLENRRPRNAADSRRLRPDRKGLPRRREETAARRPHRRSPTTPSTSTGRKGRLYEVPHAYGVPFRCLLPKGVENLMIASRAASFSHIAASSCRLCRPMMTLGQAAGTAAAMCMRKRSDPTRNRREGSFKISWLSRTWNSTSCQERSCPDNSPYQKLDRVNALTLTDPGSTLS